MKSISAAWYFININSLLKIRKLTPAAIFSTSCLRLILKRTNIYNWVFSFRIKPSVPADVFSGKNEFPLNRLLALMRIPKRELYFCAILVLLYNFFFFAKFAHLHVYSIVCIIQTKKKMIISQSFPKLKFFAIIQYTRFLPYLLRKKFFPFFFFDFVYNFIRCKQFSNSNIRYTSNVKKFAKEVIIKFFVLVFLRV